MAMREISMPQQLQLQKGLKEVDKKESPLGNSIKDFEIIKELGKGSYGTVFLVKSKKERQLLNSESTQYLTHSNPNLQGMTNTIGGSSNKGPATQTYFGSTKQSTSELQQLTQQQMTSAKSEQLYVLKKVKLKDTKVKQQLAAVKEAKIMSELPDHQNVIRYYTSFTENDHLHIVMEYAAKGDMYQILKEQRARKKYISEKDMWDYGYQICKAVQFLHQNSIIHRDIKCLNIFLSDSKIIKLGDLGVSKVQSQGILQNGTRVGTPLYLAPELVKAQPYDHKIDIWAIGCALYHLTCLEPPFQADNLVTLGNMIVNRRPKQIPHVYTSKFRSFVESLLGKNPRDRPTASEALLQIPNFARNTRERQDCRMPANEVPDRVKSLNHDGLVQKYNNRQNQAKSWVRPQSNYNRPQNYQRIQKLNPSRINFGLNVFKNDGAPAQPQEFGVVEQKIYQNKNLKQNFFKDPSSIFDDPKKAPPAVAKDYPQRPFTSNLPNKNLMQEQNQIQDRETANRSQSSKRVASAFGQAIKQSSRPVSSHVTQTKARKGYFQKNQFLEDEEKNMHNDSQDQENLLAQYDDKGYMRIEQVGTPDVSFQKVRAASPDDGRSLEVVNKNDISVNIHELYNEKLKDGDRISIHLKSKNGRGQKRTNLSQLEAVVIQDQRRGISYSSQSMKNHLRSHTRQLASPAIKPNGHRLNTPSIDSRVPEMSLITKQGEGQVQEEDIPRHFSVDNIQHVVDVSLDTIGRGESNQRTNNNGNAANKSVNSSLSRLSGKAF